MTAVLGISCHFHDAAAALVVDGQVVAAAEEERFTRRKHDASFPSKAIEFCLRQAGMKAADLDHVAFYERPLTKLGRTLATAAATLPASAATTARSLRSWASERLWIRSTIVRELGVKPDSVLFCDHHESHAASAFFASPFQDAAVLTIDGVGEWNTATFGSARSDFDGGRNSLRITHGLEFPHSLGLFYSSMTDYLGFEVNEGEFKVMGMAAYGEARYVDELSRICRIGDDGSIRLDMRYFEFHRSSLRSFSPRLIELLGSDPRDPAVPFNTAAEGSAGRYSRFYADVAASVQRLCEDAVVAMADAAHRAHPSKNLALAGGVALNGLANTAVLERTPFENLYIPPAPGDSGGALGAALHVYNVVLGGRRRYVGRDAYLGAEYGEGAIAEAVRQWGVESTVYDDDKLPVAVAEQIAAGKVVGWFQGRFEWGPRALGNRSILADPRRVEMKHLINEKVKFREQFRPFAPAVAERAAAELFDGPVEQDPARFMLMVMPVSERGEKVLPAASHFGTARVQTVHEDSSPLLARLVDEVGTHTGTPVVLNTSFNLKGEPMVAAPEDALSTFMRSGLDLLVMGNHVVSKD
ncbi:carbamoyltransferase N-terminal domain-containing protein [Kitasatospora sp. NPDC085895]|uniref:carbamoyltransferase family protein n=1 Tax=Kitasatospora sp. NPDC085895 TaxID=3155057 RepID=UPI00344BD6C7